LSSSKVTLFGGGISNIEDLSFNYRE